MPIEDRYKSYPGKDSQIRAMLAMRQELDSLINHGGQPSNDQITYERYCQLMDGNLPQNDLETRVINLQKELNDSQDLL